jgi:hypothetical protein
MQFLLMIYSEEKTWMGLSPAEHGAMLAAYGAFGKEFAGSIRGGNALQPVATAKTVTVRDGKSLTTDGPFAETKEQLGGYYLIEAGSIDEATAIASRIPGAQYGRVEVRPIMTF